MYKYNEDKISNVPIKQYIKTHNKLIPFIGAGFSANIQIYPSWRKFMDILENELNKPKFFEFFEHRNTIDFNKMRCKDDPTELTQFFYWKIAYKHKKNINKILREGKLSFRNLINKKFKAPFYIDEEYEQHAILVNRFRKLYTTNWDDLLEKTCDGMEQKYGYIKRFAIKTKSVDYAGQLKIIKKSGKIKSTQPREIIKFHGCLYDKTATSIIASSADYYKRLSESQTHELDIDIGADLKKNSFLFLGYSFSDITIKYILNQILFKRWVDNNSNSAHKLFIVTFDDPRNISKHESLYLEKCNYISNYSANFTKKK